MPKKRPSAQIDVDPTLLAIQEALTGESTVDPDEETDLLPELPLNKVVEDEFGGTIMRDYLEKQVFREVYGTEFPTERERTLQALKELL